MFDVENPRYPNDAVLLDDLPGRPVIDTRGACVRRLTPRAPSWPRP